MFCNANKHFQQHSRQHLRSCAGLCSQAFTLQTGDRLPVAAFAAWRTLAFVVFRCGELTKRMKLLLQPIQHALLTDRQPSILEVQPDPASTRY